MNHSLLNSKRSFNKKFKNRRQKSIFATIDSWTPLSSHDHSFRTIGLPKYLKQSYTQKREWGLYVGHILKDVRENVVEDTIKRSLTKEVFRSHSVNIILSLSQAGRRI